MSDERVRFQLRGQKRRGPDFAKIFVKFDNGSKKYVDFKVGTPYSASKAEYGRINNAGYFQMIGLDHENVDAINISTGMAKPRLKKQPEAPAADSLNQVDSGLIQALSGMSSEDKAAITDLLKSRQGSAPAENVPSSEEAVPTGV